MLDIRDMSQGELLYVTPANCELLAALGAKVTVKYNEQEEYSGRLKAANFLSRSVLCQLKEENGQEFEETEHIGKHRIRTHDLDPELKSWGTWCAYIMSWCTSHMQTS